MSAALLAGNAVIAKPAPQTPLIAARAVRLLLEAGVPGAVLHFVPGGPDVGQALVADVRIAGVAFTGSTAKARRLARTLPDRKNVGAGQSGSSLFKPGGRRIIKKKNK